MANTHARSSPTARDLSSTLKLAGPDEKPLDDCLGLFDIALRIHAFTACWF